MFTINGQQVPRKFRALLNKSHFREQGNGVPDHYTTIETIRESRKRTVSMVSSASLATTSGVTTIFRPGTAESTSSRLIKINRHK